MPRKAAELSPLAIRLLTKPGHHAVGGVAGLALQVAPGGARTWILRVTVGSKRRDMGLGGYPDVELAQARERARAARALVEQGIDPILQRRQAKSALAAQQAAQKTFSECAREFIDSKSAEWSNPKHASQWTNTLETYADPTIGELLVSDIGLPQVRAETEHLKKQVGQHRSQIAALKRRLAAAEKQCRKRDRAPTALDKTPAAEEGSSLRFRAKGFAAHRARLGLSAREMGLLLGASPLSVYKWEHGKVKPRAAQLASIAQVRRLGKREAAEKLSSLQA